MSGDGITRAMIEQATATVVTTYQNVKTSRGTLAARAEYWPAVLFHPNGVPVLLGKDGDAMPSKKCGSALQRARKLLVTLKKTWHEKNSGTEEHA